MPKPIAIHAVHTGAKLDARVVMRPVDNHRLVNIWKDKLPGQVSRGEAAEEASVRATY